MSNDIEFRHGEYSYRAEGDYLVASASTVQAVKVFQRRGDAWVFFSTVMSELKPAQVRAALLENEDGEDGE